MASILALGAAGKAGSLDAEASYELGDSLKTVGIATGIGTVLGLSTIAFYESPTSHMGNAFIGAGAGLLVGLGVASYLLATSSDEEEIDFEELLPPENKPKDLGKDPKKDPKKDPMKADKKKGANLKPRNYPSVPVALTLPTTIQPGWAVALRVVELRF